MWNSQRSLARYPCAGICSFFATLWIYHTKISLRKHQIRRRSPQCFQTHTKTKGVITKAFGKFIKYSAFIQNKCPPASRRAFIVEKITSSGFPQQRQPRKRSYRPWGCYLRPGSPSSQCEIRFVSQVILLVIMQLEDKEKIYKQQLQLERKYRQT